MANDNVSALLALKAGGGGGGSSYAVEYVEQSLSDLQKAQARTNIGATDALTSIPDDVKQALLNIVSHVAFVDAHGQDYYDELSAALYLGPLESISAVFTQGDNIICELDALDDLRQYLVVTAHYSVAGDVEVTGYDLSGTLEAGTSTITVTYGGETTTFTVSVRQADKLFEGVSLGKGTSGGTVTFNSDGSVTMTTTGDTTTYGLCYSPYGSTSLFKTWAQLKGHRIRLVYSVDWESKTATSKITLSCHLTASTATYNAARTANHNMKNITDDESGIVDWIIPSDSSDWSGVSSIADSNYFSFRHYLVSSTSGANVTFTATFYDLGADS